jgi:hypothetical protein
MQVECTHIQPPLSKAGIEEDDGKLKTKIRAKIYLKNGFGKNIGGWVRENRYDRFTVTPYQNKAEVFSKTRHEMERFILGRFPTEYEAEIHEQEGEPTDAG